MEPSTIREKKDKFLRTIKLLRPIDIAVILTSVTALYLFRFQDGYQLSPIWQLKQPEFNKGRLYIQPLIIDIDGNGLKEIIIASEDKLQVFAHHINDVEEFSDGHATDEDDMKDSGVLYHLHLKSELKFIEIIGTENTDIYPLAMNVGCRTMYHELCPQCLAIVWSDWSVTLLSRKLTLLWKSRPMKLMLSPKLHFTEMSILVVSPNSSLSSGNGLVIVGGVLNFKEHQLAQDQRQIRPTMTNKTSQSISDEKAGVEPNITHHIVNPVLAKFVGHYTTYALDLKSGELKWKHEPGDFEQEHVENDEEELSQLHFKLRLRKKRFHKGELHWTKYSQSLLNHLPYSWTHAADSDIALGSFKTDTLSAQTGVKPRQSFIPKDFSTYFKEKLNEQEENDHEPSNVVVLRHRQAIEVLSVVNGNPVCTLPLDASKGITLGDINGDNTIDTVRTHIHSEQQSVPPSCYVVATGYASTSTSVHFNSSVCQTWTLFGYVDSNVVEPGSLASLPPFLVKPIQRSVGATHHIMGYNLSPFKTGLDTFVLLSSGKLTVFSSSGIFLWQVDTGFTWSRNANHKPSIKIVSLTTEKIEDAVVILGSRNIIAISLIDGSILSTHSLPCSSVQPLISGDIDNDISEEFLVRCADRYVGFSLKSYNRVYVTILLYSGIACAVACILFIMKFIENEDHAMDTIEAVLENMRLMPAMGPRF